MGLVELTELKENIVKLDLYDLASLVVKRFEEYEKNNIEYNDLEYLNMKKNELTFYFIAKELDYFNK